MKSCFVLFAEKTCCVGACFCVFSFFFVFFFNTNDQESTSVQQEQIFFIVFRRVEGNWIAWDNPMSNLRKARMITRQRKKKWRTLKTARWGTGVVAARQRMSWKRLQHPRMCVGILLFSITMEKNILIWKLAVYTRGSIAFAALVKWPVPRPMWCPCVVCGV